MDAVTVKSLARETGFDLVGITSTGPTLASAFYPEWLAAGYHGEMSYLEGDRGVLRSEARQLLASAKSLISLGLIYDTRQPYTPDVEFTSQAWISRYAWGADYHDVVRRLLYQLVERIEKQTGPFEHKVCVDTAPLLERAYAAEAGLGWIGKNTCLINEKIGSWIFLGEILTSLELAFDDPAPFRCGTCTRCIDACPTDALVPLVQTAGPSHALDSTKCISYWTIELHGPIPEHDRPGLGPHVFGCDICQDVCPWNRRAPQTDRPDFQPRNALPELEELAKLTEDEFNERFADSPIERARYRGFLRNVAVAMGNSGNRDFLPLLEKLAADPDPLIHEHARWAIEQIGSIE